MTEATDEPIEPDRTVPQSVLSPGLRLAIAGIGVLLGIALIFIGLHSFESSDDEKPPASLIVPTSPTVP